MKTFPYNACDYRCERCLETEQCAVFRMGSERDARNFTLGRETGGIEAALRDVGEVLGETKEMLQEHAEEPGVDWDELADAGPRAEFEEAKKDPLYRRSFEFTLQAQKFLERIESAVTPEGREFFDDIIWHHTVVSAKVFRAVGNDDPDIWFDAVNSAAVAAKSLTICIMAFDELASRYSEFTEECRGLLDTAKGIKQVLCARFLDGSRLHSRKSGDPESLDPGSSPE